MSARAWLQAFRIHTSSLTIPGTLLGVAAAGHLDLVTALLFGAWALVFHAIGFLGNNLVDLPWDRNDAAKAHFPLVTGAVPQERAVEVYVVGLGVILIGGGFLTGGYAVMGPPAVFALVFLLSAVVFGIAYNSWCKKSLWAPLFISASFASLPAFAYFASGGTPGFGVWSYVMLYGFALMMCQIAWSGYYKDLKSDPVSLLRRLGVEARVPYTGAVQYHIPFRAGVVGRALRLLCPLLAFLWSPTWPVLALGLSTVLSFEPLLRSRTAPRASQVRWMGVSEILAYWTLLASVEPLLGSWLAFTAWALLPLAWYVVWNKALWNTSLAPRV